MNTPVARATSVDVRFPSAVDTGDPFVIELRLPAGAAAVDGRVLADQSAELWGVAPVGRGAALHPERIPGGWAFGAYDLGHGAGLATVRLVMDGDVSGRLPVTVAIDTVADAHGARLSAARTVSATVAVGHGGRLLGTPATTAPLTHGHASVARDVTRDGTIDSQDVADARSAWADARFDGNACDGGSADANGDGCTDIADVQVLAATAAAATGQAAPAADGDFEFVVNSTAETADANLGDGMCDVGDGSCTLYAALQEANRDTGDDTINFNIPGGAPAAISVTRPLPLVGSATGSVSINGYTEPGSKKNDAAYGSNAVLGVVLHGPGVDSADFGAGLRITTAGNSVAGLALVDFRRPVFLDGVGADANRIVGNWIGIQANGAIQPSGRSEKGVFLNGGAGHNVVGTRARANRNVIYAAKAIDHYGRGTNGNVEQNNQLCILPGGGRARCAVGIDHDFGPKRNLAGGSKISERNVIGPTGQNGIEYSHGWNPSGPAGAIDPDWQIFGNRASRNWIGFKMNGSYDSAFVSGQVRPDTDNGQAVNVYDGSVGNTIEGNYLAARYMGIQVNSRNSRDNVITNNVIGVSPRGERAPMAWWGIKMSFGTSHERIIANTIRYAKQAGVLLGEKTDFIRVSRNIVTGTNGEAIDLIGRAGPDPNDKGDKDDGANGLLNHPVISSARKSGTTVVISGRGKRGARVEVFKATRAAGSHGLPSRYLGHTTVGSDRRWRMTVHLKKGARVTALQITSTGNTSELSANVRVTA